jgi:(4S)-4-hydroxy-5-phosphonooxypentane-2,3-dione isomerase
MAHVLVVRMTVREGEEDHAAELIGRLTEATRSEPGNVHYIAHRAADDPRVFMFYEQYADQAAFEAHGASEHFKSIAVGELFPLLEGERERAFYETLD